MRFIPTKTTTTAKKPHLTTILATAFAILTIMPLASIPQASFATGNGAPSGPHFNLNIIGVSNTKNFPTADGSGGHVIDVPLRGHCNIDLTQGTTFYVLDDNCLDGTANFQLPPTNTVGGNPAYTVWARVVGIPGGSSSLTTCATDPTTGDTICSIGQTVSFGGHGGKSTFSNVTNQLTTLCYVDQTTGKTVCVNVFDPTFQNYFWSYDNNGNKVLQLRFYPVQ
ncbi:MAG: hypothetical protein ACREBI_11665 [Nitrosotalea sp.]